jgi:hypothetical protein
MNMEQISIWVDTQHEHGTNKHMGRFSTGTWKKSAYG